MPVHVNNSISVSSTQDPSLNFTSLVAKVEAKIQRNSL
jgi:hypothetical protein